MKSGVFFERDGILNLVRDENGRAPLTLDEFQINPDAVEPLTQLRAAGFVLIATTNQPGLSRGYQSRREMDLMHSMMNRQLPLHDTLICPHDETDRCPCRKPKAGLFFEAAFKWHIDLDRSFVISQKWQDAKAAHIAGCTSLLIKSRWNGSDHHDFILPDIASAVAKVFQLAVPGALVLNTY